MEFREVEGGLDRENAVLCASDDKDSDEEGPVYL
jgi:hypothetical protein